MAGLDPLDRAPEPPDEELPLRLANETPNNSRQDPIDMAQGEKPKATRPKRNPKRSDKAQSERFIEAARTLGIEETGDKFGKSFEKILNAPKAR